MSVLYIALPAALLMAAAALGGFLWALRQGQMDDLETPPMRMLHDDPPKMRRGDGPSSQ